MASILIVEDELLVASDLRATLEDLGHTVPAVAASGEVALDRAAQHRPDLVLMDLTLRGAMDGIETATRLWAGLRIPVVYLTANADRHSLERAIRTDPYGYLVKPFDEDELRQTILAAVARLESDRATRDA